MSATIILRFTRGALKNTQNYWMPSYVVTGSSRGIGLEFVRQLSANTDNIVFGVVRNPDGASELKKLETERANFHVLQADVTNYQALKAAAGQVAQLTGGTLEYLINNAAYQQTERKYYTIDTYAEKGEIEELKKDMLDNFNANTIGVIHSIDAFLPLLKAASAKATVKIISLSSGIGDLDLTLESRLGLGPAYCISKAALNMVVAKYATRFADDNMVFVALSPGLVNTATGPPTPEDIEQYQALGKSLKAAYPDWDGQALTPEASVRLQLGVIEKVEHKDTGAFISHWGNKQWV